MFDVTSLRQLINEHGVNVTLRKKANGVYDATTGVIAQTSTDYAVRVYFFNNDPSIAEFNTIVMGERRVVVSDILLNGQVTPDITANDEIVGDGDTVNVTRSSKIRSGGATMCQLLYVKE
jgi:hypothetical protein